MSKNNSSNNKPSSYSSPTITQTGSPAAAQNGGTFTISTSGSNSIYFSATPVTWTHTADGWIIYQEEEERHPKSKKIKMPDGSEAMECVKCSESCQWAEPNQDNGTFKCYTCRTVM